jgi:hypothetical protein
MAKNPKRPGGTPPKEHQFKSGQSGNPGGRPKKLPTAQDIVTKRLMRLVTVMLDGKRQEMTVFEALTDKHLAAASPREFLEFIRFAFVGEPAPSESDEGQEHLDEDDAAILSAAINREIARREADGNE